jgi:hypothetical protein
LEEEAVVGIMTAATPALKTMWMDGAIISMGARRLAHWDGCWDAACSGVKNEETELRACAAAEEFAAMGGTCSDCARCESAISIGAWDA